MKPRRASVAAAAVALIVIPAARSQWDLWPAKNVPRLPNGNVDMKAKPVRTSYDKPDLSGFWIPEALVKHLLNLAADMKQDEIPLTAEGKQLYQRRIDTNGKDHPGAYCLPSGIPEKLNIPDGLKLVQTQDLIIFLHESRTIYRQVFLDGRPLPEDPQPTWMGYSIGSWDGDTLVVETVAQNGKTWLDMRGLPGGEKLKVTERYSRPTVGHMDIEVTIEDPQYYTKPWKANLAWTLLPDAELIESICEENNRDPAHMVGK